MRWTKYEVLAAFAQTNGFLTPTNCACGFVCLSIAALFTAICSGSRARGSCNAVEWGAASWPTVSPSGQLLFHIVGAVAQFERRDLIAERVRAGMAHARSMGKRIGRPRAKVDLEQITRLRSLGHSLRGIARTLEIPVSRVRRALVAVPSGQVGTECKNGQGTADSR